MNKKVLVQMVLLGASALFFIYLFVQQFMKALNMFSGNIETFNLLPVLFAIILLIVLLVHFGLFIVLFDRRKQVIDVEDEDRWWEKWDMA